jgi:transcriptional activator of cad operon
MAKQYWVGEFFVDLSRNQISKHDQPQSLAPKALLVLTYLAKNHGKVVSYDELLDNVWPNSVVTPNTLQRSVAQLRKALGENSKGQSIIKTHAKQGYSLECDVIWSEYRQLTAAIDTLRNTEEMPIDEVIVPLENSPNGNDSDQSQNKVPVSQSAKLANKRYWIAAVVVSLIIVVFLAQYQKNEPELKFNDLRYITATDDKEYGGTYSPDGKFILFNRYFDKICMNNIWAKNIDTFEEIQLTAQMGTYGSHSLSADGKNLVFVKQEDCTKPITQNICYKLMSLNFNQALLQPQTPNELLHCQNSAIAKPVWIDDQHIALMQKVNQQWRLIQYSINDNSSTDLYEIEGGNILSFAYSEKRNLLAVTSIKDDGLQYIEMISPTGEVQSSHRIQIPQTAPRHLTVYPSFAATNENLIFGYGGQLYTLSEQGEINRVNFPFDESVGAPYFHPDGKRLLLIKGKYDSDIASLPVPVLAAISGSQQEILDDKEAVVTVFERSIEGEDYARFQPDGSRIAFSSGRTGEDQVWLSGDDGTRALSQFPKGSYIRNIYWDSDGNSLLVLANAELHQVFLNERSSSFNLRYPVAELFHWDSEQQLVIANIIKNGIRKFVKINLSTLDYKVINNKRIKWAAKSQNDSLIFMDHMDRIWQKGIVEDKLIELLAGHGSSKRFVIGGELIYGINRSNQLWYYNLESAVFKLLGKVTKDIDYLTDIKANELLVSVVVAAKKEVIELSVAD